MIIFPELYPKGGPFYVKVKKSKKSNFFLFQILFLVDAAGRATLVKTFAGIRALLANLLSEWFPRGFMGSLGICGILRGPRGSRGFLEGF